MLEPTLIERVLPQGCDCGHNQFESDTITPFYTHQQIELPEIQMKVSHFILHKTTCSHCGKTVCAGTPKKHQSGYSPRLSAMVAELSGSHGASRQTVQDFWQSVLGLPISVGGFQRIIDRTSEALKPLYDEFGKQARKAKVNYIDKTSWFQSGKLSWLWTMVNHIVAFFKALEDEDWRARERAAKALREIWDTRAVKPLIAVLRDESKKVRKEAGRALQRLTKKSFIFDNTNIEKWQHWCGKNKETFLNKSTDGR